MARNALAVFLALGYPASLSAANVPKNAKRPKVKVTFDRTDFQMSYGKTLDLCMKVVPAGRFTPKIQFASSPAGVIEGKFGGSATCAASFAPIQIKASLTQCAASASLLIRVNNKTVATLPGAVLLPDIVSSTLAANEGCPNGYGASKKFFVHFRTGVEGATADFDGLPAHENLTFVSNGCGLFEGIESDWAIGPPDAPSNAVDDGNSKCFSDPVSCTTVISQTFTIGSCFTSPPTTITFQVSGEVGDVTRSDEGGQ